MDNAPHRFLTWRWEVEPSDNENAMIEDAVQAAGMVTSKPRRLTYINETKQVNSGLFILGKEDHTLGNLIRVQLLRDPSVVFAGYRMPHPLIFDCHIRVKTKEGQTKPIDAFQSALSDLFQETDLISKEFEVSSIIVLFLFDFLNIILC